MMTTKALIKILSSLPPYTKVFIDGYEGGIDDINRIYYSKIALNVNDTEYDGDHEDPMSGEEVERYKSENKKIVKGVIISRMNRVTYDKRLQFYEKKTKK